MEPLLGVELVVAACIDEMAWFEYAAAEGVEVEEEEKEGVR